MNTAHSKENGYGPDADTSLFKTQLLRIWAEFYGQRDEGGSGIYCFPTFEEIDNIFRQEGDSGSLLFIVNILRLHRDKKEILRS